jgi:hypothetical protein
MSRIAPQKHEPIELHLRKAFSWMVRDDICARQDNQCAGKDCLATLYPEPFEVDHIRALSLGGTNDLDNLEALCSDCHKIKTRADKRALAKAKRLAGETKTAKRKTIPSRGFSRTLSKGFDGKVRQRKEPNP